MNLVIDDAVEVKQITKTNPEEKRRTLGTHEPNASSSPLHGNMRLTHVLQDKSF